MRIPKDYALQFHAWIGHGPRNTEPRKFLVRVDAVELYCVHANNERNGKRTTKKMNDGQKMETKLGA